GRVPGAVRFRPRRAEHRPAEVTGNREQRRRVMTDMQNPIGRRTMIAGAGLALGSAALPQLAATTASAQPAAQPDATLWTGEYWAKKGEVSLYLYRKRIGAPAPGAPAKPVLFLVHGSSISSRPTFDLTV